MYVQLAKCKKTGIGDQPGECTKTGMYDQPGGCRRTGTCDQPGGRKRIGTCDRPFLICDCGEEDYVRRVDCGEGERGEKLTVAIDLKFIDGRERCLGCKGEGVL